LDYSDNATNNITIVKFFTKKQGGRNVMDKSKMNRYIFKTHPDKGGDAEVFKGIVDRIIKAYEGLEMEPPDY
jgi:hypothetical protein